MDDLALMPRRRTQPPRPPPGPPASAKEGAATDDRQKSNRPPTLSDQPAIANPASPARDQAVSIARWSGVAISIVSVVFAVMTYFGVWNHLRGDDLVAEVAARFDKSYSEDASIPVRRNDKDWQPLLRIITKYTHAELPHDREPFVFARFSAVSSAKTEAGGKVIAEWTAPTTPVAFIYKDWPGQEVPKEDYRIVGSIQDLHEWIRTDEADFDFFCRTIIFGLLSACVGTFLALRT
jgi:hypothetical protein